MENPLTKFKLQSYLTRYLTEQEVSQITSIDRVTEIAALRQ